MHRIGVVYLARARDGIEAAERFLFSYAAYPAGLPHELLIVHKGLHKADARRREDLFGKVPHGKLFMADFGFDIRAYRMAAEGLACEHLLFFNTFSEILGAGWLEKPYSLVTKPGVGLVGATGSWESMYANVLAEKPAGAAERATHWLRKTSCRFCFAPFPNYHVRTNAFIMQRELMLKLWPRLVLTKRGAYLLENGANSLTRRVVQRGLKVMVVGRDGTGFEKEDWNRSWTFRQGNQENLLIGDNQTRRYQNADEETRKHLARAAWG
jgi:hypothetical protein